MNQNRVNFAINFWQAIRNYAHEIEMKGPFSERGIAETVKSLAEARVRYLQDYDEEDYDE